MATGTITNDLELGKLNVIENFDDKTYSIPCSLHMTKHVT